jgi:transcriptional regulator with XRE-family HTH domain
MRPDELKELRTKLKLTQKELADALGVSFVTYSRWENSHNEIPSEVAKLMDAVTALMRTGPRLGAITLADITEAIKTVGVRGVIASAGVRRLIPTSVVASLSLLPGFVWLGGIAGLAGLGALSFFQKSADRSSESRSTKHRE